MSFNSGSGDYAPPPPKRGLSPWAWVGIGCGTLTLLGFGGCAIVSYHVYQAVNNAMSPEESMRAMTTAQIPIYPGAQMDAAATKVAGGTMNFMSKFMGKGVTMAMVAFNCPDPAPKVHEWYAKQVTAMGYSSQNQGEQSGAAGRNSIQHMYSKGNEIILVQTQDPTNGSKGSVLVLAHFKGLPKNARVNTQ